MSSLALLLNLADELDTLAGRVLFDDFGHEVFPYQLNRAYRPCHPYSLPSRRNMSPMSRSAEGQASQFGKDGFQVCMDVQQFKPSELTVKTVDNFVVIEGKHEEREDDQGSISRHFVRRYSLPKGFDPNQVLSTLSSDGILTVKVPLPVKPDDARERLVQIQQTGPAHLSVKENPRVDAPGDGDSKNDSN